jgi:phosphoglycerate dehydrogenase-like enzyme
VSDPYVVALVEELPEAQIELLRDVLPDACRLATPGNGALSEANAVILRDGVLDADAIEAAARLEKIVRIDLGSGSVDADACRRRGIDVEVVPSPSLMSVAEHAVTAILMLLKRIPQATERLRAGVVVGGVEPALTTQEEYAYNWVGLEHFDALWGQTIGLVGLGRIGSHAARLLRCFGADVAYTKRTRLPREQEQELGVRYLPFDDLLRTAVCVSLHNRFTEETESMMGEREFSLMQQGSLFVNTARGRLVDEDALVAALTSGRLAGAALDVFRYEPLPPDSPLLSAPNLVLTPHTGGIPSSESQTLELREAVRRLRTEAR